MLAGRIAGPADYRREVEVLTPDRKVASRAAGQRVTDEVRETRAAAIVWSLQALYCGRAAEVAQLVRDVWAPAEGERLLAAMRAAIDTRK